MLAPAGGACAAARAFPPVAPARTPLARSPLGCGARYGATASWVGRRAAVRSPRVRCAATPAPEDESTFGRPAAPRELWEGFARSFRARFLAEAAKPAGSLDVALAALLLAAEDDAVASRTAVPLPVEAYLERVETLVSDYLACALPGDDHAAACAALDTFLYDACRFRAPVGFAELYSPYRTYLHHALAQKVAVPATLATIHVAVLSRLQARGAFPASAVVVLPPGPSSRPFTRLGSSPDTVDPHKLLLATLDGLSRAFWAWEWRPEQRSGFVVAARAASGESGRMSTRIGGTVMQPTGRPFGDLEKATLQLERLVALSPAVGTATRDLGVLLAHRGRRGEALQLLRQYADSNAGKAAAAAAAPLPPGVSASLTGAGDAAAAEELAALEALLLALQRTQLEQTFQA